MAIASVSALLHLGNLLSTANTTVTDTHPTPKHKLGTLSIMVDAFGYHRIFRYVRFTAANTAGGFTQRAALVTGTATAAAGEVNDTMHLADTSNFTAGLEEGKICQINVASGAAPEGEAALIVENTISQLTFDSNYPLSAVAAVGDTYSDWAVAHYAAGALYSAAAPAGNAINCGGIVMGVPALGDYGWSQIHGFHPAVQVDANSDAIVADTAGALGAASTVIMLATGASQQDLYIGWFPMATATEAVQAGFVIDVFTQSAPVV